MQTHCRPCDRHLYVVDVVFIGAVPANKDVMVTKLAGGLATSGMNGTISNGLSGTTPLLGMGGKLFNDQNRSEHRPLLWAGQLIS